MKTSWKTPLTLALVLLLALVPALALGEAPEEAPVKLQAFLDALLAQGTPVDVQTLDAADQGTDGVTSIYCPLADYLFVSAEGDDLEFAYTLSVLHADLPDGVDADTLYAQFLSACTGCEAVEAADAVAWLQENMVRTSYYGLDSARSLGDYTVALSASRTDSEVFLSALSFEDD